MSSGRSKTPAGRRRRQLVVISSPPKHKPQRVSRSQWPWYAAGAAGLAVAVIVVFWLTHSSDSTGATRAGSVSIGDLHSVVMDPTDPNHIFVGGHVAAAETTDGGRSFHAVPGLDNGDPMAWSVSADGRTHVASGHMGLRTSRDGGKNWTNLTTKLPYSDVHAVGLDPDHPSNWLAYVVGRGVYATADGGQTWTSKGNVNANLYWPIVISPGGQSMTAIGPSGIVRSSDGGRNWTRLSPLQATFLAADPADPRHLYAASTQLSESRDAGVTWSPLGGSRTGARAIAAGGGATPILVSVTPAGDSFRLVRSQDGGNTWT